MLDEIISFSKELDQAGIYERIQEQNKIIDKPILVIPVKDDLSNFEYDDIHVVVKDYGQEEVENQKNKTKELKKYVVVEEIKKSILEDKKLYFKDNSINFEKNNFVKISDYFKIISPVQDERWKDILLNIKSYTDKILGTNKNIDRPKGISSYNLFIFNHTDKNKLLRNRLKNTYIDNNQDNFTNFIDILKLEDFHSLIRNCFKENIEKLYKKLDEITNCIFNFDNIDSFTIIFKFPNKVIFNKKYDKNFYKDCYEYFLKIKCFVGQDSFIKNQKSKCSVCFKSNVDVDIPSNFNNLDGHKPFLKHLNRLNKINIRICRECSLDLIKIIDFFRKTQIKIFPLFLFYHSLRSKEIAFLKSKNTLSKDSFHNIVKNIYLNSSENELDFYLVIYDYQLGQQGLKDSFLYIDYVTGFQYKKNNLTIFKIESLLADFFCSYNKGYYEKLKYNYFTEKIDTKSKELDSLIYSYRAQIFDYIYRADYNSLDKYILFQIFFKSLSIILTDIYNNEINEDTVIKQIKKILNNYSILDNNFGGNFMETVERIKKAETVNDLDSFSFYVGQCVYYLLKKSEKKEKKHSMVEAFISVQNIGVLGLKLDEFFKTYSHKISLTNSNFNLIFSKIWAYIVDHKNEPFGDRSKSLFYSGYFDSDDNIFDE